MKELVGRWRFEPDQLAEARLEGTSLILQVVDGPEIRLGPDLRGVYRLGPRSGERPVVFEEVGESLVGRPSGMRARVIWRFTRL